MGLTIRVELTRRRVVLGGTRNNPSVLQNQDGFDEVLLCSTRSLGYVQAVVSDCKKGALGVQRACGPKTLAFLFRKGAVVPANCCWDLLSTNLELRILPL